MTKLTEGSKVITNQTKILETPNIVAMKSVFIEHSKLYKITQAYKVS